MKKHRYFIRLSYNGTRYSGWQIQPNGNTVQAELTKALSLILSLPDLSVVGAGRTDAGVHARNFYAHFDSPRQLVDFENIVYKLNGFLPYDIAVHEIFPVKDDMHSRFSALRRTYNYYITTEKDPFKLDTALYLYGNLDLEAMNKAAALLLEYKDFTSFSKLHTQVKTNICCVYSAQWRKEDAMLIFEISADRFLRNMVRAIVGTLLQVGKGKLTIDGFRHIIEARDRSRAGESAPALGLFLTHIEYRL